jgi:hypothetical protein
MDVFDGAADEISRRDTLKDFINKYETLQVLWNNNNPDYFNKYKRMKALDTLLPIYRKIKANATIVDVKRKINTLRCNYRKELKKILSRKAEYGADDAYKSKSWVFNSLHFLDKLEHPNLSDKVSI